jgi:hypothetical protein
MRLRVLLALAVALIVIGAVVTLAVRETGRAASRMQPRSTPGETLRTAPAGTSVDVMLRLQSVEGAQVKGALLEKRGGAYADVGSEVEVRLTPNTGVVMGGPADIKRGAVVQIAGVMDDRHIVVARQVVVLTGYVKSSPGAGR